MSVSKLMPDQNVRPAVKALERRIHDPRPDTHRHAGRRGCLNLLIGVALQLVAFIVTFARTQRAAQWQWRLVIEGDRPPTGR